MAYTAAHVTCKADKVCTHGVHMGYTWDTQQLTAAQHPDALQYSEQQLAAELLGCGSCEVALCIFSAMTIQAASEVHSSTCKADQEMQDSKAFWDLAMQHA